MNEPRRLEISVDCHALVCDSGREYMIEVKHDDRLIVSSWGLDRQEQAREVVQQLETMLVLLKKELVSQGLLTP